MKIFLEPKRKLKIFSLGAKYLNVSTTKKSISHFCGGERKRHETTGVFKKYMRWYKKSEAIMYFSFCHSNTHENFNKGTLGTKLFPCAFPQCSLFEILLHISRNIVHLYLRCSSVRFDRSLSHRSLCFFVYIYILLFWNVSKVKYYLVNQWSVEIALVNISFWFFRVFKAFLYKV